MNDLDDIVDRIIEEMQEEKRTGTPSPATARRLEKERREREASERYEAMMDEYVARENAKRRPAFLLADPPTPKAGGPPQIAPPAEPPPTPTQAQVRAMRPSVRRRSRPRSGVFDAPGDWLDHGPRWAQALIALAGIAVMIGAFLAVGIALDWLGLWPEATTECVSENITGQCTLEIPLEPAER